MAERRTPTVTVEPTEDASTRPVELSRVWIHNKIIAHDVEGDDLADVLQQNGDASAWAVLPPTESGTLHQIARFLDLDDLAISQVLSPERQARYEEVGGTRLAMLGAVDHRTGQTALTDHQVSLIIADQLLVILAADPIGRRFAHTLCQSSEQLSGGGPDRAAQLAIRRILGGYAEAVHDLEATSDSLAADLFGGEPLSQDRKLEIFKVRQTVTALRRDTEPAGEVIDALAESGDSGNADERHWGSLSARHDQITNSVDALSDSLTAIFETSLSLDGAHTNEVMKKLTGWAAIIAIPTLITGFVGMNVDVWFAGSTTGFYIYLVLMLVSAAALYLVFKRKSWI